MKAIEATGSLRNTASVAFTIAIIVSAILVMAAEGQTPTPEPVPTPPSQEASATPSSDGDDKGRKQDEDCDVFGICPDTPTPVPTSTNTPAPTTPPTSTPTPTGCWWHPLLCLYPTNTPVPTDPPAPDPTDTPTPPPDPTDTPTPKPPPATATDTPEPPPVDTPVPTPITLYPPPAPSGLTVTTKQTTATFSWNKIPSVNDYAYEVKWGRVNDDGGEEESTELGQEVASGSSSRKSRSFTGLTPGKKYYFKVRAYGNGKQYAMEFGPFATVYGTTKTPPPPTTPPTPLPTPSAPSGFNATPQSGSTVRLSWNSVEGANKYEASWRVGQSGSWGKAETTSLSHDTPNLICNTGYSFRVRAHGDGTNLKADWGDYSTATATPCPTPTDTPTPLPLPTPLAPTGVSATAQSKSTVQLSWNSVVGANKYEVAWKESASSSYNNKVEINNGSATGYLVPNLTCNTGYSFKAKAHGDSSKGKDGWGDYSNEVSATTHGPCPTVPPEDTPTPTPTPPPLPTITIALQNTPVPVPEGTKLLFTLTASYTLPENLPLTVNVRVTEVGSFLKPTLSPPPSEVTIAGGSSTAQIELLTENDQIDEIHGEITVTIEIGTGYRGGNPSSVSVAVKDNDVPQNPPTGLRANGHLDDDGKITLRWNHVKGVSGYNVRYVEEICDSGGDCKPDGGDNPKWKTKANIATSGNSVKEATLGGLTAKTLYRVEVQAVIVDPSKPSDFALVYPTDRQPSIQGIQIATIPLYSFQANGQFDYYICNPTQPPTSEDPSQLPPGVTVQDIKDVISQWDEAVKWSDANGNNIIRTSGSEITECADPEDEPRSINQVLFYNDEFMDEMCGSEAGGCWAWPNGTIDMASPPQSILMRDSIKWNSYKTSNCKMLYGTLTHEAGHALGMLHGENENSIIHERNVRNLCGPTVYDVVAIMANYQSR